MAETRAIYFGAECDECGTDWAEIDDGGDGVMLASSVEEMREWWESTGEGLITESGRWLCSECALKAPEVTA